MGRPAGWMKQFTGREAMRSPGAPSVDFHPEVPTRPRWGMRIKTWTGFMRLDQVFAGIAQGSNAPEIP